MHRLLTDKIHKLKPKKDGEVPQLGEAEKHMLRHQQHLANGKLIVTRFVLIRQVQCNASGGTFVGAFLNFVGLHRTYRVPTWGCMVRAGNRTKPNRWPLDKKIERALVTIMLCCKRNRI